MLVYHAQVQFEDRHELDPKTGRLERFRDEIVKSSSMAAFKPAGQDRTFEKGPDGAFDVPDEIGHQLLGKQGWFAGAPPKAVEPAPAVEPEVVQVQPVVAKPRRGRPPKAAAQ